MKTITMLIEKLLKLRSAAQTEQAEPPPIELLGHGSTSEAFHRAMTRNPPRKQSSAFYGGLDHE